MALNQHTQIHDEMGKKQHISKEKSILHLIMDGGVYDYRGTFRVVVSDGKRVLTENKGQLYRLSSIILQSRITRYGSRTDDIKSYSTWTARQ
jgi:hypothetical protein